METPPTSMAMPATAIASAAMGLDTLVYIQAYRDLVSRTKSEA